MAGELVYQTWQRITGKPWSEAAKGGFTNGSASANLALQKRLLSGWNPYQAAPAPVEATAAPVTAASAATQIVDGVSKQALDQIKTLQKLYIDNPLGADQALLDQSKKMASDQYTPDYNRILNQFTTDVGVKMGSFDSQQQLINDLKGTTTGLAGQSEQTYKQARQAATEGLGSSGAIYGGTGQSVLGGMDVARNNQLQNVGTDLMRQFTEGNKNFQSTLTQAGIAQAKSTLAGQILTRGTAYNEAYPGANQPDYLGMYGAAAGSPAGTGVDIPQPYKFNPNVGL